MSAQKRISVLAELERLGLKYQFSGEDELRVLCPFHEDTSPSCSVNVVNCVFYCNVCKAGGDFIKFLSKVTGYARSVIYADLSTRYDLEDEKTVDPDVVEKCHSRIWEAGPLLKELRARGVTDELIRKYRLGEKGGRVTIPITSRSGAFVNIRSYLPGAPGADKMKNLKGRGKPRLFPVEQTKYESVAVVGGEIKAIVAADQLNKHNVGAVGTTSGEGAWDASFNEPLRGKRVYVIYDVDEVGQKSAAEVALQLHGVASWVGVVSLPLDTEKYPHGDVNDFVAQEDGDLWPLLEKCKKFEPEVKARLEDEEPKEVRLAEAYSSTNTKRRMCVEAVIAAMAEETYVIPKKVTANCNRDQECCPHCTVFVTKKDEHEIHAEDPAILEFVDFSKNQQRFPLMEALGIPKSCGAVEFDVTEFYQADDVRVSPKLEVLNTSQERFMQRAIVVSEGVQLNENYALTGRQYPHPRNQSATLLVSAYESVGDALSHYHVNGVDRLKKFQPESWTVDGLRAKMNEVYADLESNVTRIYQRKRMHLLMDLTWHSPLLMTFDGRAVKGWTDVLVVGDSAQGKSETASQLMQYYDLGEKVECKNATVAGLLGGLQQLGNRWFVSWGVIPTQDRRMVLLEELKGASTEVISRLTDMRSSGFAEIPKIEKRRAHARTRLLSNSNPRSDRPMSTYNYGIQAISELIGAPEDVRRFDACYIVAKEDVDPQVINQLQSSRPTIKHTYDEESCRELILWVWTRGIDEVLFERDAEILTLQLATALTEKFSDHIPVVDRASMRYKLGRLAAAVAGRTFSSTDGYTLLVKPCHVQFMHDVLDSVYSSKTFGYLDYTRAERTSRDMSDAAIVEKHLKKTAFAADLCEQLLFTDVFDSQDVMDWTGSDRVEAQATLSLLVRKRAVRRRGRKYHKTPGLIELLKKLIEDGLPDVPDYVEGDF